MPSNTPYVSNKWVSIDWTCQQDYDCVNRHWLAELELDRDLI